MVEAMNSPDKLSFEAVEDADSQEQATDEVVEVMGDTELPYSESSSLSNSNYVAFTIKLPSEQLSALQLIWLDLKRMYGTHSPDKSGMIQQAISEWLKRFDGPEREKLLRELLEIRENTRKRQFKK